MRAIASLVIVFCTIIYYVVRGIVEALIWLTPRLVRAIIWIGTRTGEFLVRKFNS